MSPKRNFSHAPKPAYGPRSLESPAAEAAPGLRLRWLSSWPFAVLVTVAAIAGAMGFAITSLFRMPNLPNCRTIFWPLASAAVRLQCADSFAAQDSVESLLEAIALVKGLPKDHPLAQEIDGKLEVWASRILEMADDQFQEGDLEGAIATVKKIPQDTAAAQEVDRSIRRWQKVWDEGEDLFERAEAALVAGNFKEAFSLSVQLLDLDNDHWSDTQYSRLTRLISMARADSRKLGKVKTLADRATLASFKEALELLRTVSEESVLYDEAQQQKTKIARSMLQVAEKALDRQDLSVAEQLVAAIPRGEGLDREVADFQVFTDAYRRAWSGDALGLDAAITRLQSLGKDRPLYGRGQRLIARWRSEMQALAQLDTARQTAALGTMADLRTAIGQAQEISYDNPRWQEASSQIDEWQARIETVEDQPILLQAEQLATLGTTEALRSAIQTARQISPGRALGDEARKKIDAWQGRIEAIEDRPLVDRARRLASQGDISGAISVASRISPSRRLYDEISGELAVWRDQQDNQNRLQRAIVNASSGSASALAQAIAAASEIPSSSRQYGSASEYIDRWSWELLTLADSQARSDLGQAIATAQQIPSRAEAYATAQSRVQVWQQAR